MNNVSMMDAESEKRSASTISFSSSSSNSSSSCHRLDRLVDAEEIQAAETLAQLAMRDSHSADKWCTKQDTTRVTRESPTLLHSDLSLGPGGQAIAGQYPDEKISTTTVETEMFQQDDCSRHMKVEQDADVLPNTSYSLVRSRKSRRNLTEEEKEVRRIRRILANRESARQTIRRRQALCEELTRKAASLVVENENLKREKQLALNEYQSLETTNKHLKAQIAKSINTEVEKTPVEPGSSVAEFGNQQSSPSSSLKDEQDNLSLGKPCSSSSSLNTMANVDYQAALPIKLKTAASGWTEAISINGPGWATPRSSLDGGEKKTGCYIIEKYHEPSLGCNGHASAVKQEHEFQLHSAPNNKVSSTAYIATSSLEKKQGQCICQGRNLVDAVAAAEARKRRKELTKQKSIHNRQSRMHC
ncbi:uncharacterized protein [Glycine max]|uniref:uncharacterized protein isoform X6 n=1 Tax=Glycine max TaxID=3847 RepID=UPI0007191100|nr:uncharacterized protein LOC778152 isoform X6 [Glycine max]|eukprot:XP_014629394.1 uncharacterized protein LOC778152 isoform X4 [Glycine max]